MSRVALIGENSIGYVNALVDIWNHRDCAVLLDWRMPFLTAFEMMIEAGVSTCYIDRELLEKQTKHDFDAISFIAYDKQNVAATLLPDYV